MTIQQAIDSAAQIRGSVPDTELLIKYINSLENRIKTNIVNRSYDSYEYPFTRYTSADYNTELLAPEHYSEVYVLYLIYMIDARAGNENRQESMAKYQQAYDDLAEYWLRTHMPIPAINTHREGYGF